MGCSVSLLDHEKEFVLNSSPCRTSLVHAVERHAAFDKRRNPATQRPTQTKPKAKLCVLALRNKENALDFSVEKDREGI